MFLRLCLVAVKRFPENTYFSEMLIFGKGKYFHVFGCISKNFPENIFWCLEKKKENTNPEKYKPQPRKNSNTVQILPLGSLAFARSRLTDLPLGSRDLPRQIFLSDLSLVRSREGEIAINGAISRRRDRDQWRDLATARSRSSLLLSRARTRSLSLSLIFRKCFEGKIEV